MKILEYLPINFMRIFLFVCGVGGGGSREGGAPVSLTELNFFNSTRKEALEPYSNFVDLQSSFRFLQL